MRGLLCASAALLALMSIHADEKAAPKPNTLTAKEIADAWILLFDGETTFGWSPLDDSKWSMFDGMLAPQRANKGVLLSNAEFGSYQLSFDYQAEGGGQAQILVACDRTVKPESIEENALLRPGRPFDLLPLTATDGLWAEATLTAKAGMIFKHSIQTSRWRSGGSIGKPLLIGSAAGKRPEQIGRGHIALGGHGFLVRNLKLKPLGLQPIFTSKDLAGWKEIKTDRTKSKFTVTENGELNIKDGPGDLQTEGQWDDFILQLECKTKGKHLNSGVFFRCLPGQFWSGYESQIRNQWQGDDRTKPVDYGTGGIYNRQPARKVVANDNEWFTKTIIAHGSHMAVWVNGYQVSDFTDSRPPNVSARKGLKLDKGPISLQGHDPTTDLSFRNIRIAELPGRAGTK